MFIVLVKYSECVTGSSRGIIYRDEQHAGIGLCNICDNMQYKINKSVYNITFSDHGRCLVLLKPACIANQRRVR